MSDDIKLNKSDVHVVELRPITCEDCNLSAVNEVWLDLRGNGQETRVAVFCSDCTTEFVERLRATLPDEPTEQLAEFERNKPDSLGAKWKTPAERATPEWAQAQWSRREPSVYFRCVGKVHPDTIVLWFLALNYYWFEDATNLFYGQREAAKAFLDQWAQTGELPDDNSTLQIYIGMKFREWLESSWEKDDGFREASAASVDGESGVLAEERDGQDV